MPKRRILLRRVSGVAATGTLAGLAGCQYEFEIGDTPDDDATDDEDEEPDPDADEGPGPEEDEPDAEDELATARELLGGVADDLRDVVENEDVDFDDVDAESQLEDAGDALDAAMGADPTEAQRDQIEDLRNLHRVLDSILEVPVQLSEGIDEVDQALEHFDDEAFDDAVEELREAEGTFRRPEGRLDRVEDEFEEIETDVDPYDEINADAVRTTIDGYRDMTIAMQGMAAGFRDLNHGFDRFYLALEDWEDENWFGAERHFDRSNDRFEDATATFLGTEADVPPEMHSEMAALTCEAEAMSDATAHYRRAMEAAQEGDWDTFEEETERGEEAAERCE